MLSSTARAYPSYGAETSAQPWSEAVPPKRGRGTVRAICRRRFNSMIGLGSGTPGRWRGPRTHGAAGQIERLVTQWAENEQRAGLTTAERVGVIAQLSAFGVSAAKIAKRTRSPRSQVDAALAVAGSELANAAAVR